MIKYLMNLFNTKNAKTSKIASKLPSSAVFVGVLQRFGIPDRVRNTQSTSTQQSKILICQGQGSYKIRH